MPPFSVLVTKPNTAHIAWAVWKYGMNKHWLVTDSTDSDASVTAFFARKSMQVGILSAYVPSGVAATILEWALLFLLSDHTL